MKKCNWKYCLFDLEPKGILLCPGILCKPIPTRHNENIYDENDFFIVKTMTACDPAFYPEYVYCYKVVDDILKAKCDDYDFTYNFQPSKLLYKWDNLGFWEKKLNDYLGLSINNRFEILDL